MQIRKCRETDIADAGKFYDSVVKWLNDHINYPRWIYGVYPSEDSVREKTEEGSQYICLQNEKIVGVFALNDKPQGSYWKGRWKRDLPEGSYMVLHALAVDPEMQRQGTASEIIRFCIEQAKSLGYQAIRVDIVPGNKPARALFEQNGFTWAGDADLDLGIGNIPAFSLYELNW
ncbi:MAG: GNAT family N-acetyltransferase [Flexilinea sp.]|nr:GNAT family N-acetyltransferase [Flexilinea sp.]